MSASEFAARVRAQATRMLEERCLCDVRVLNAAAAICGVEAVLRAAVQATVERLEASSCRGVGPSSDDGGSGDEDEDAAAELERAASRVALALAPQLLAATSCAAADVLAGPAAYYRGPEYDGACHELGAELAVWLAEELRDDGAALAL
jgi:hypothetical protein